MARKGWTKYRDESFDPQRNYDVAGSTILPYFNCNSNKNSKNNKNKEKQSKHFIRDIFAKLVEGNLGTPFACKQLGNSEI